MEKPPITQGRRRGHGFRQAGSTARPAIRRAAADAGFAEPDVLLRWPEIAGEALAALCRPVRVKYGARGLAATLIVQAPGARAPEVEMQAPRMIERINQFYGYRAVNRIRITQSADAPGMAEGATPFAGPAGDQTTARQTRAAETAARMAQEIEDPDLRAALARMGAHVLANPKRQTQEGHDT